MKISLQLLQARRAFARCFRFGSLLASLAVLCLSLTILSVASAPESGAWPSAPPTNCPFASSAEISGVEFTGRHAEYTQADTWYPSWAADGNLYSPWTDGVVNGLGSNSSGTNATTGYAKIIGDDPLNLQVVDQGVFASDPSPYAGRYPCGSLVYKGVWYYGTYCLHPNGTVPHGGMNYNWPWLGPFVGFRYSTDFGRAWTQTPCTPAKPLFSESALQGEPVKIGSPHFVDFGKNITGIPQGTKGGPDPSVSPRNATGCGGSALRMFSSFCLAV
jgi:hypothetical protein